jgi:hypothetical protein
MRLDGAWGESADVPNTGEVMECTYILGLEGVGAKTATRWMQANRFALPL